MLRKLVKKRKTISLFVTSYKNLYFCVKKYLYRTQEDCRQNRLVDSTMQNFTWLCENTNHAAFSMNKFIRQTTYYFYYNTSQLNELWNCYLPSTHQFHIAVYCLTTSMEIKVNGSYSRNSFLALKSIKQLNLFVVLLDASKIVKSNIYMSQF